MQNRSKYRLIFAPIPLPEEVPLLRTGFYEQQDREITYLHRHDRIELGYWYSGEGIFLVENKVLPFRSGDATVIPAGAPHLARSTPGSVSRWRWLYADFDRLLRPAFPRFDPGFLRRLRGAGFANLFPAGESELPRLLHRLFEAGNRIEELTALSTLIALEIRDRIENADLPPPDEEGEAAGERIAAAIHYLGNHYPEPVSLKRAAALCSLSMVHFRRLFRRATGHAPLEYLNLLRIAAARGELENRRMPVSEVAVRCGFRTLSSFNRQFRIHTGMSPREYRRHPERFREPNSAG